jgi:hypothetical protein
MARKIRLVVSESSMIKIRNAAVRHSSSTYTRKGGPPEIPIIT